MANKTLVEIKNVPKQLDKLVGVDELSPDIEKALFVSFLFIQLFVKILNLKALA